MVIEGEEKGQKRAGVSGFEAKVLRPDQSNRRAAQIGQHLVLLFRGTRHNARLSNSFRGVCTVLDECE